MSSAPRRRGGLFGLMLVLALLCAFVAFAGASGLAISEVMTELGQSSGGLGTGQRASLAVYLLANASAIDSAAGDPELSFELSVEQGASAQAVVDRLVEAGVVSDGRLLRNYMRYRGLDTGIQAGSYEISGAMTIRELANSLQIADAPQVVFTIVEGWRLEQIAEAVEGSGLSFGAQEFMAAAGQIEHPLTLEAGSPEGLLFPDTYHLQPDSTPSELLTTALDNFELKVDSELKQAFNAQGLTLLQAVTLASIVEREAVAPEERPLIAAVFLRRLKSGLPLEADPTVQYPLGLQPNGDWWKSPLSLLDLEVDSPYNTYRYPELPPGPIAAPGLASLQAVGSPVETTFLYFRAACDGSGRHEFAETFDQHLLNACP